MNVSKNLLKWYDIHKRALPWRESGNAYFIWLSEIILQQTRVQQGIKYYYNFVESYPTVFDLANAPLQEVLKLWQGLGYYSRARNLHKTAKIIVESYSGRFPDDFNSLKNLPGIGEYTAGAIVSLAYNKPFPAVDGNVYRVLSRYYGISTAIDSGKGKKEFYALAHKIISKHEPGKHNQAMIELGAMVCLPRKPICSNCVISAGCHALRLSSQLEFPLKLKKPKVVHRYFYYLVIRHETALYLKQRPLGDIWAMLYDFPLIEEKKIVSLSRKNKFDAWKHYFGNSNFELVGTSEEYKHVLSHQILHAFFIEFKVDADFVLEGTIKVNQHELEHYPLPRLIDKYLSAL